jgi:streptogramin lyase
MQHRSSRRARALAALLSLSTFTLGSACALDGEATSEAGQATSEAGELDLASAAAGLSVAEALRAPASAAALTGAAAELDALATISPVRAFAGGVHGLAVGTGDRLYLSNSFGSPRAVFYLDPPYTGGYVPTGITASIPSGLLSRNGSLYVADVGGNTVRQFDAQHQLVRQWTADAPWSLTAMPDGSILSVSNGGAVQRLRNNNPNAVTLFSGLDAPFGIASAGDGTFWVSEQGAVNPGAVTRRKPNGKIVESIPYTWDNPEGLLVDRQGALWIAETSRGEILRYYQGQLTVVGTGLGLPVVLTQRPGAGCGCDPSTDTIYANSANAPAQLLAIDPCN